MSLRAGTAVSVVIGPDEHGVVHHALGIADAAGIDACCFREPSPDLGDDDRVAGAAVVHLHYTDRLFGADAEAAAVRFADLAARVPGRLIVSLHDVPGLDGTVRSRRRAAAYRLVAAHADLVVVASRHERARLRQCGIGADARVAPLPITLQQRHRRVWTAARRHCDRAGATVGVVGFVYPGKGHVDVVEAVAWLPDDVAVIALGRASDGHEALPAAIGAHAAGLGRRFTSTGYLTDQHLDERLAQIDVPVVPARQTSASASLHRWIGAGRRPVVASNCFTRELAAAAPDLVRLYDPDQPGELARAIDVALTDPASTWHDGRIPPGYSPRAVGQLHRRFYRELAERP